MRKQGTSMDSRISLRWIAACIALICAAGALIAGSSARVHRTEASVAASRPATPSVSRADTNAIAQSYGKLPLSFEPNQGQTGDDVKFLARGNGYTVFLTPAEAVFALRKGAKHAAVRMNLDGANAHAQFSAMDEFPGKTNYLIGNQPSQWRTNIPNYGKVRESGIYPGIDLVYYGNQRELEYDFIVAPGADTRSIALAFSGVDKIATESNGDLGLVGASGEMRLRKPFAYQEDGGAKQVVTANYVVSGKNRVKVRVGKYDPLRPLVIDPIILTYSTYLGGSGIDGANSIQIAPDGTAFVAGGTSSTNFPTAHPLQPNDGGSNDFPQDAFVTKLSADGSQLLYSTYLGGTGNDVANGIAVDAAGAAYVTGNTESPNFPVTPGSFNTLCGGDGECGASLNSNSLIVQNGFVAKLNAAGSTIIYAGFLGNYENVSAQAIAVDQNEIAYVTGKTGPNGVPSVTSGTPTLIPIQPSPAGAVESGTGTTATITTTSPNGLQINQLVTIAGVGGTLADPDPPSPFDGTFVVITVLSPTSFTIGATTAAGTTSGAGTVTPGVAPFPITETAFQLHYSGGPTDAFVSVVSATGSGFLYSSYAGGSNEDTGYGIAADSSGNAYVTGLSYSTDFPVTASALQSVNEGQGDAFALQVNTNASGAASLVYSTLFGGSGLDQGNAIAIDSTGAMYITGGTSSMVSSLGFALPGTPFQSNCFLDDSFTCEGDAFVAKFNPAASGAASLVYFTYIGGSLADSGAGIAVDASGDAYITGSTVSQNFPTTLAIFQPVYGGGNDDAFVTEFDPTGSTVIYSTYLGGSNTDNGYGIAVDTAGSAYVAGQTCSTDFPIANPAQGSAGGNCDAFISKVSVGTGIVITPSGLIFPDENIGSPSAPESVTITNGTVAVDISSITVIGTNATDFALSTTCPSTLPANGQCTISVIFTPSTGGPEMAAVQILDSAPGSPQIVNLSGSGLAATPGFTISAVPTTATVSAGNNATFALTLNSVAGFAGTISLTCGPAPQAGSCTVSPSILPLAASGTASALLTVKTGVRNFLPPVSTPKQNPFSGLRHFGSGWFAILFALLLATMAMAGKERGRRAPAAAFGFLLAVLFLMAACGGGTPSGVPAGTPAGTYQVTVTGVSGSLTQTTSVTIQVN
jgi:hypothetical protein